jgi:hypothetical protein
MEYLTALQVFLPASASGSSVPGGRSGSAPGRRGRAAGGIRGVVAAPSHQAPGKPAAG